MDLESIATETEAAIGAMVSAQSSQPNMGCDESWAARWLESSGWRKEIAGEQDFSVACRAVSKFVRSPEMGLFLFGGPGVGKTFLAERLYDVAVSPKIRINCADNDAVDLLVPPSDAAMNNGVYNSCIEDIYDRIVFIDDLGAENIIKNYGNDLNRIACFITRFHQRGKGRLIITSNISIDEVDARYGSRVVDRVFDRCIVAKLGGESKRRREIIA